MNSFKYLGMKSFDDVDDLLIGEYLMLMKAHRFKQFNKQYNIHLQSYLNHAVKATKTIGKRERSIYPTFKDFFDYDEELQMLEGVIKDKVVGEVRMKVLSINMKMNEVGGE